MAEYCCWVMFYFVAESRLVLCCIVVMEASDVTTEMEFM